MKNRVLLLLISALLVLMLTSCDSKDGQETPAPETQPPVSVTPPATPSDGLITELSGLWGKIDGSTATIPLTAAIHGLFGSGGQPPAHNTTALAYEHLIEKSADLIFVTYPSDNEFTAAQQNGVELDIIPVVKDALVFLVNVENPVDNVTRPQLQDIYAGKLTNWRNVGGPDESIIPYQRTANSGSQTLLLKLVMDGQAPMTPPAEWVAAEMGDLVEIVSDYDNAREAIGYSMFYYVNNMYGNSRFKLLGVDGVKPERGTIARGEYPLEDYYYAVIRKETPADSPARKLIDWLLTDEGQTLAVHAGYIPLRPMENVEPDDTIDPVYLGDTDNSSGTGGTEPLPKDTIQKAIEDIVHNGVRKPLSDMFYDGFNYIRHINGVISEWLFTTNVYDWRHLPREELSKRPFTGIPNDYPNYTLVEYQSERYLRVEFPGTNPFFHGATSVDVRLTSDISPYGAGFDDFSLTYEYAGRLMPQMDLFTYRVKSSGSPDIAYRINERLRAWTDGFPGDKTELLEGFIQWYASQPEHPYRLQPVSGRWQNYLSVSYTLQTYDGPSTNMPMVYTICFDLTTGDAVKLADLLPRELPFAEAMVFTPAWQFEGSMIEGPWPSQENFEDYVPAAGTVIDDAWLWGNMLGLYITEPDGHKLQVVFYGEWE